MSNSYLATALEVVQGIFESQAGFVRALIEGCKIFGVLGQSHANGLVDQIGNRAVDLGCLDAENTVQIRQEAQRWKTPLWPIDGDQ